ncbi:tyrosine-type recombinase/integrase [Sulfidibacter corallicola]|uniref:Tyrosine-type recombinase/integrase n=1 Tax=Sulfidibacter corallicola TaxID=2818388 RepID=A0A8A4TJJ5_SULCO|nr:tyrosine-type recombinase/integrase [Sulfidibacter corallicola]
MIPTPRLPKRLPLVWSPEEIQHLIRTAGQHCTQTQVILIVAYATGLRLSELCHLRLKDLDPDH